MNRLKMQAIKQRFYDPKPKTEMDILDMNSDILSLIEGVEKLQRALAKTYPWDGNDMGLYCIHCGAQYDYYLGADSPIDYHKRNCVWAQCWPEKALESQREPEDA